MLDPGHSSTTIRVERSRARHAAAAACTCELCGESARVSILTGYRSGEPNIKHYCLSCADAPREQASHTRRPSVGLPLISLGVVFAALALVGDFVPGFAGAHPGIGPLQAAGLSVAIAALAIGSILRIELVAIAGAILLVMTCGADLMSFTRAPGLGRTQALLIVISLIVVAGGLLQRGLHHASRRKATK